MQVDHPSIARTGEVVNGHCLDEICSPAVHVAHVAIPVTVIVYLLVFS